MSHKFDKVQDLIKQKGFYPHDYMSDFEVFKKRSAEKRLIVRWQVKKLLKKSMNLFLRFGMYLKWKQWKIITTYS